MAKTKREFILIVFALSGVASILDFVALGTEQWITSETRFTASISTISEVKYGLFSGTLDRDVAGNKVIFEIKMACQMDSNACAMLCGSSPEIRSKELKDLINKKDIIFDAAGCSKIPRRYQVPQQPVRQPDGRTNSLFADYTFINAGLWVSTIFFLVLSALFSVISTVLSLWNAVDNPVNAYFNILGLYIYNGVAACSALIVSILWGAQFGGSLVKNIGIMETINGDMRSDGLASLGFSYWILMVSWLLHFTNIALLYARQHLINQEPSRTVHYEDSADQGIIIY